MDLSRVLMLGRVDKSWLNERDRNLSRDRERDRLRVRVRGLIVRCLVLLRLISDMIIYKLLVDFFIIFINFKPFIGILGDTFISEYIEMIDFIIV